jgi:hypothetical protein
MGPGGYRPLIATVAMIVAGAVAACGSAGSPTAQVLTESPPSIEASSEAATASASVEPSTALSAAGVGGLAGEPDASLTPGAANPAVTQATIRSTICVSGWTATVRPPSSYTTKLKGQQIVAYGYSDRSLADYEEDHLIPLELGGAPSDPRNLWPEPYVVSLFDGRPVGARVKDQLENKLKALVCAGSVPLADARREIATDWVRTWFALSGQSVPPLSGPAPTTEPPPATSPSPEPSTAAASLSVRITSLTSPVADGSSVTLRARTAARAACTISVVYKSGPSSAQGLGPKTADGSGAVSWTWTVGSRTTRGSWPVTVTCSAGDSSASAEATLVVK